MVTLGQFLYHDDGLEARRFQHQSSNGALDLEYHLHRLIWYSVRLPAGRLQASRFRSRSIPYMEFRPGYGFYSLGLYLVEILYPNMCCMSKGIKHSLKTSFTVIVKRSVTSPFTNSIQSPDDRITTAKVDAGIRKQNIEQAHAPCQIYMTESNLVMRS
ncbi:hypothetical protein N7G274_004858 [Stereocaulon virgatum]|uniref:Uncharacterized protein n=1 Tax=Stereocaulon virgatum TaxID=373712 RepID=A0ABR4AG48_9LECA